MKIIMVTSAKGGVGKSTVAASLAIAFKQAGQKVALLDADIHGPSLPRILGIKPQAEAKIAPIDWEGVPVVSLGTMMPESEAVIWRGPILSKILHQLMRGPDWGDTEYLIIDTPPGTGDIHLTLGKNYPIYGAIAVSTPQPLSCMQTQKSITMLRKFEVKVLGLVANMSYLLKPSGSKDNIFGEGECIAQLLSDNHLPLLASVPLWPPLSTADKLAITGSPLQPIFAEAVAKLLLM